MNLTATAVAVFALLSDILYYGQATGLTKVGKCGEILAPLRIIFSDFKILLTLKEGLDMKTFLRSLIVVFSLVSLTACVPPRSHKPDRDDRISRDEAQATSMPATLPEDPPLPRKKTSAAEKLERALGGGNGIGKLMPKTFVAKFDNLLNTVPDSLTRGRQMEDFCIAVPKDRQKRELIKKLIGNLNTQEAMNLWIKVSVLLDFYTDDWMNDPDIQAELRKEQRKARMTDDGSDSEEEILAIIQQYTNEETTNRMVETRRDVDRLLKIFDKKDVTEDTCNTFFGAIANVKSNTRRLKIAIGAP